VHPARFPASLVSDLVKLLSEPGDTVFDPFVGSGTVAQVCEDLGRKYIGSDKSLSYLRGAYGRLQHAPGARWHAPALSDSALHL
jgi:DNA modification methylase